MKDMNLQTKADMIEKAKAYIEKNLDQELTLEGVARELHYSKGYLARAFARGTGCTVYKYIQGRRLDKAAEQLAETQKTIAQIAQEANYGSQQAFDHAFRLRYHCTPQDYRKAVVLLLGESSAGKGHTLHFSLRRMAA